MDEFHLRQLSCRVPNVLHRHTLRFLQIYPVTLKWPSILKMNWFSLHSFWNSLTKMHLLESEDSVSHRGSRDSESSYTNRKILVKIIK